MIESDYIETFLEEFKSIQEELLEFIENEENIENNFRNLNLIFESTKIRACKHKLRLFLRLLLQLSNDHHREPYLFSKIDRILAFFKEDIKKYFSNSSIYNIFHSNKRILLFLIDEKIMTVDEYFIKQLNEYKFKTKEYPAYFQPEIKPFENQNWFPWYLKNEIKNEIPANFNELRKEGENESYICELIRKDAVKEFITYVNKNAISRDAKIDQSIYETNPYLINKHRGSSLIEYAAFYGSIQIFNFLKNENAKLDSSIWLDTIHSKNSELIHILEYNNIKPDANDVQKFYRNFYKESIKCYHNDMALYFVDNYLQMENENSFNTF